jgi:hypothetical protein
MTHIIHIDGTVKSPWEIGQKMTIDQKPYVVSSVQTWNNNRGSQIDITVIPDPGGPCPNQVS